MKKIIFYSLLQITFLTSWGQYWKRQKKCDELVVTLDKDLYNLGDSLIVTVTNNSKKSFCNVRRGTNLNPGQSETYKSPTSKTGKDKYTAGGYLSKCKPKYKMRLGFYWEKMYFATSKEYLVK